MQINSKLQLVKPTAVELPISTPSEATHIFRIDIVNKDGSVKRVEIHFNKTDRWSEAWPDAMSISELFESAFYDVIMNDRNSVGAKKTLINKLTGNALPIDIHPMITKPEFLVKANQ